MKKNINAIFLVCFTLSIVAVNAFADDVMSKAKKLFLQRQYWQTIEECTRVINENPQKPDVLSEANYFAGASYVNLFDFLSAKKSFKAVVEKYRGTAYYEDAYLGLGEVEFLQENFDEGLKIYYEFLAAGPSNKRLATLYFRLAELNLKKGDEKEYKKYYDKLQTEFPLSFEARDSRRLVEQEDFYTVQVGAFTNYANAEKFIAQLKAQGYDVYSVLCLLAGKNLCRVRVGKFKTRQEAEGLKRKLEKDGYFAKIFP